MEDIFNGRYTAEIDGSFVVFLVGMRVNKLRAIRKWWPVAAAMRPMLETLYTHPEKGFLGGEAFFRWRVTALLQYWRSFDDLERFASRDKGISLMLIYMILLFLFSLDRNAGKTVITIKICGAWCDAPCKAAPLSNAT